MTTWELLPAGVIPVAVAGRVLADTSGTQAKADVSNPPGETFEPVDNDDPSAGPSDLGSNKNRDVHLASGGCRPRR